MEPFLWLGFAVCMFIAGYLLATVRDLSKRATFHSLVGRGESVSSAWNQVYGE